MAKDVQRWPKVADLTLDDIRTGLEDASFTSVDLVPTYLSRIDEINPEIKTVAEIDSTAIQQAALLDQERAAGTIRGYDQDILADFGLRLEEFEDAKS